MTDQVLMEQAMERFTKVIPRLYRRIQTLRLKIVKELNISRSQLEVISLIVEKGPLSITEISAVLVIAKPNITNAVDDLVTRAYVTREAQQEDRRMILVQITPQGNEIREQFIRQFRETVTLGLARFSKAEIKQFIGGMTKLDILLERIWDENIEE